VVVDYLSAGDQSKATRENIAKRVKSDTLRGIDDVLETANRCQVHIYPANPPVFSGEKTTSLIFFNG
jgi:hypothetical protein